MGRYKENKARPKGVDKRSNKRSKGDKDEVGEDHDDVWNPNDAHFASSLTAADSHSDAEGSGDENEVAGVGGEDEAPSIILSAEEKRLLLAREYLQKLGLDVEGEGLDNLRASLDAEHTKRSALIDIGSSLEIASQQIIYEDGRHIATCVDISPCDEWAYTGGKNGRVLQWNVQTGSRSANITATSPSSTHVSDKYKSTNDIADGAKRGAINCMRFALDGRLLITGDADGLVKLYDVRQWGSSSSCIKTLAGHRTAVTGLAVVGDHIYTSAKDLSVRTWSLLTQSKMDESHGHESEIVCLDAMVRNRVVTGGLDESIRFWKLDEGKQSVFQDKKCPGFESIVCATPLHFLAGGHNGYVSLWSSKNKKPMANVATPAPSSHLLADTLDSSTSELSVAEALREGLRRKLKDPERTTGWIHSLAMAPETNVAFSGSDSGIVQQWDLEVSFDGKLVPNRQIRIPGVVNGLRVSKSGAFLMAATAHESRLGRWSTTSRKTKVGLAIVPLKHDHIGKL